jgi:hypothetical protein
MIVSLAPQRPTVKTRTAGLAAFLACAAPSALLAWSAGHPLPTASGAEVSSVAFGP